jgi:hypothetical protein
MNAIIDVPMSEEAELDRKIERLIGRIVAETATEEDREMYRQLTRRRVELMQPGPLRTGGGSRRVA